MPLNSLFLYPCLVCLLLCKEEGCTLVSLINGRRDIGLIEGPLSMFLLGLIWDMDYVNQLPCEILCC